MKGATLRKWYALCSCIAMSLITFQFKPYTESQAECQKMKLKRRYGDVPLSVIMRDADPFLHEAMAYEQIRECCVGAQKTYFPAYYGVVKIHAKSKAFGQDGTAPKILFR
jgi:hypothetical protein